VLKATKVQFLTLKTPHSHGDKYIPFIGGNPIKLEVDKWLSFTGGNPFHLRE